MPASPTASAHFRPDFRHVEAWIFDLDNTLYRADSDLFARSTRAWPPMFASAEPFPRGRQPAAEGLLPRPRHDAERTDQAARCRRRSLSGGGARYRPHRPGARSRPERGNRTPARTALIFTNGCRNYAARVLDRIGLGHIADDVWDIRTMDFQPKPFASAYDTVIEKAHVAPRSAAMFEDLARNLVPAHAPRHDHGVARQRLGVVQARSGVSGRGNRPYRL